MDTIYSTWNEPKQLSVPNKIEYVAFVIQNSPTIHDQFAIKTHDLELYVMKKDHDVSLPKHMGTFVKLMKLEVP